MNAGKARQTVNSNKKTFHLVRRDERMLHILCSIYTHDTELYNVRRL